MTSFSRSLQTILRINLDGTSRSPYKEMDIFRKSVLLGSMGCGFTYGDAYENASGQLTLTYKMPLEL